LNYGKEKCEMAGIIGVILYLAAIFAFFFWLVQLLDLLFRQQEDFESHTHKLAWFLALIIGNIVAAVWYYLWKHEAVKEHDSP